MIGINSFGEINENSDQYINRANRERAWNCFFLAQQMISNLRIMKLDRLSLSTMKDFYFLSGHPSLPKKKVRSFSTFRLESLRVHYAWQWWLKSGFAVDQRPNEVPLFIKVQGATERQRNRLHCLQLYISLLLFLRLWRFEPKCFLHVSKLVIELSTIHDHGHHNQSSWLNWSNWPSIRCGFISEGIQEEMG